MAGLSAACALAGIRHIRNEPYHPEHNWLVNDRGKRNHPLSHGQRKKNRRRSSIRSKVEHPFHVIKNIWKHTKVRYRGIEKNTLQLHVLFALYNLYLKRRQLLA